MIDKLVITFDLDEILKFKKIKQLSKCDYILFKKHNMSMNFILISNRKKSKKIKEIFFENKPSVPPQEYDQGDDTEEHF